MEVWTDGEIHVHAHEGGVRVIKAGKIVAEDQSFYIPWNTPLAVDVEQDRIWTGAPLRELRLSDLSTLLTFDEQVRRVVALGDGRLAVIVGDRGQANTLMIGRPKNWTHKTVLGPFKKGRAGVSQTKEKPPIRVVGLDPYITATEHGVIISDGQCGIVISLDSDHGLGKPWLSGGQDETELFGYAAENGVVVTTRWAARAAAAYLLTGSKKKSLGRFYGGKAIPANGFVWQIGDPLRCVDYQGKVLCEGNLPGFVQAVHASGNVAVAGGKEFLHVIRFDGKVLEIETTILKQNYDVVILYQGEVSYDDVATQLADFEFDSVGTRPVDDKTRVTVGEFSADTAKAVADKVRDTAISVEIEPCQL